MTRTTSLSSALFFSLFSLAACELGDTASNAEAREAVDAVVTAEKGASMSSDVVEITTNFTLGQAAEAAAEELAGWFSSQIPCSSVSRDGASLTVDFGTLDDECVYNGRTWAGELTVSIAKADEAGAEISHAWSALTDGDITLNGAATVTWTLDGERQVVHDYTWTNARHTLNGTGDRSWTVLESYDGLEVDGERSWTLDGQIWTIDIQQVEVRGQDPVPQDGAYVITTPNDNTLTLAFTRLDEDSIEVTVSGTRRDRSFIVNSAGDIEADDTGME